MRRHMERQRFSHQLYFRGVSTRQHGRQRSNWKCSRTKSQGRSAGAPRTISVSFPVSFSRSGRFRESHLCISFNGIVKRKSTHGCGAALECAVCSSSCSKCWMSLLLSRCGKTCEWRKAQVGGGSGQFMMQHSCCSGAFRCRLSSQHLPTLVLSAWRPLNSALQSQPQENFCITTPIHKCRSLH